MTNPSESPAPAAPPTGGIPAQPPGLALPCLPAKWAIWLGYAGAVCIGLVWWYHEASSPFYQWFFEGDFRTRHLEHLFFDGFRATYLLIGGMHLMAWWAARTGAVASRRAALADLGRVMVPGLLLVPILVAGFFMELRKQVLLLSWAPMVGLVFGLVVWRFLSWRTPLPGGERLRAAWRRLNSTPAAVVIGVPLAVVIGFYIFWFVWLSVMRHHSFGTCMLDFTIYDQLMWNAVQGRWLECAFFNFEPFNYRLRDYGNNFFAEHFIPTFFLLFPFYWLFPSPLTLLVLEPFYLALAAVPVYFIARRKLNSQFIALVFSAAWLMNPILQQKTIKDFHVDGMVPLFLLGAVAAYLYGYRILYFVLLLLTLGCKEEMAVAVAALGVFLFFGEKDRKIGGATFALGVGWFIAVVMIVMPWFRGGEPVRHLGYFRYLVPDAEPGDEITKGLLLKSVLTHPIHAFVEITTQARLRGLLYLIGPFALTALWSKWALVFVVPSMSIALLSGVHFQHTMEFQYGITILPMVAVASIYGMAEILRRGMKPEKPLPASGVAGGSLALLLAGFLLWGEYSFMPGGGRYDPVDYAVLPHNELAHEYLNAIPEDARVSAQIEIGSHLGQRRYIYMFPEILDAEYIMLDTRSLNFPMSDQEYYGRVRALLNSGEWGVYMPYEDGFLLLKRGHPTGLNEDAARSITLEHYRPQRYGA